MTPLTIGIDARAAAEEPGGRGRYVRELLRAIEAAPREHRYVLYAREPWDGIVAGAPFEWRLSGLPDPAWHLRTAAAARACDALLSTNSYLTAWFAPVPTVIVVYDMVSFLPGTAAQARAARIERATLGLAVRRARAITTISEATRDDLVERFPRAAPITTPIALAAGPPFAAASEDPRPVAARHGLDGPYLLALGTLEPRKNLPRLVEAFASLSEQDRRGARLAVVGGEGWDTAATLEALESNADLVVRLGHVPDADLPALYQAAELFCYPSIYEGFGLPVLEAMRCGAAVLTSDRSSLPEVGGEAAYYVDPLDAASIAGGIRTALADPDERARRAAAGAERAEQFTWAHTAAATLDLLEAAAAPL